MNILKNIEAVGKCLLIDRKILVIADLHIGYEEALQKRGFLIPRTLFSQIKKEILEMLEAVKPEIIVINGDLKHEFGAISTQEWFETREILDIFEKRCKKIILIKGNHDKIIEPFAKRKNIEIKDFAVFGSIAILHGNKIIINKEIEACKTLIIGHEHPAISLQEEPKQEKYKCFLLGNWKKQKLIVMPSFFPANEGTDFKKTRGFLGCSEMQNISDIKKEKLLSPYLHQNLNNFEVFIIGDKIYKFGRLKDIK